MVEIGVGGDDLFPLTDKGLVSFEDFQIQGFDGQDMNPFDDGSIIRFVNSDQVVTFGGLDLDVFPPP
jgi:hypothetical protein